jgi:hypothetical protein
MKKFALFAMLLGSGFLFGCENKPAEKPKDTTKTETTTTPDKKEGDATTPAPTGDTKTETPPAEPTK